MKIFKILACLWICALQTNAQSATAIDFALKNVNNQLVSLKSLKAEKGIILVFVTNDCPVSEMYQQRIEALQNKYAAKGFPVVAIDPVDSFQVMKDTAASRHYPYYFLYDSTQKIAWAYKVKANTHCFVLRNTPTGFKVAYDGAIDNDYSGENVTIKYVENAVEAILINKPVVIKKTRALGCPIRYRR